MRGDKPSVGDRVVTLSPYDRNGGDRGVEGTVTRVGRTLFDVTTDRVQRARGEWPSHVIAYRIDTWLANMRSNEAGSPTRCYTVEEWAERDERAALLTTWRRWRGLDSLSTDQLRRLVAILNERGEP